MVAPNDPSFHAKRNQERRAIADQIAAGQAHQAYADRLTAQGRAWQREVADVAYQHNNRPQASASHRPAEAGLGWALCSAAVKAGALWLFGNARRTTERSQPVANRDLAAESHPQTRRSDR
jgi:hypothetical protein